LISRGALDLDMKTLSTGIGRGSSRAARWIARTTAEAFVTSGGVKMMMTASMSGQAPSVPMTWR
jgi:hypothetical protein